MFNADWLRLEVTPDQFNVETVQAPHVRIHDLVLRVFGEHLHTRPSRRSDSIGMSIFRLGVWLQETNLVEF